MTQNPQITPEWIAVDCSATQMRATAMGAAGPLAQATGETSKDLEAALLCLIAPWLSAQTTPVIACGWDAAPFRAVPCMPADAATLVDIPTEDARISLRIAPGLSQTNPADMMCGEETVIAGALALNPDFDGVICLPGLHSRWVHVSAKEVVSFQTFLTGELFSLLSQPDDTLDGFDPTAFEAALSETLSRPEKLGAKLFSLRAEVALMGLSPRAARSGLVGLLIGTELAAAKPYWLGQPIILIGAPGQCDHYAHALRQQGITPATLDAGDCALAGLSKLRGLL
ncbi:2-dehydro-3-deoxygalactonokinase [Pseudorhodobacter turbinis]|uniref:2-dehydro-3-deoxygalactonokinase n=1 Tax=Pseudorhodobacter turbinis TaxID=2500533 RepID=A0A4P8EHD7_9RHOB|nr:2-dehydro-3-deoxygalactonokinase [Pseudorhodobacter turbinis]QCO56182.1 2-dehydro-3-deoxygalactonokinase [Pseudorhodobacter turbinis]